MKRALAICASLLVFGAVGFGFSISGSWSTDIQILPDVELDETVLTLTYTLNGWDITSRSVFDGDDGFSAQRFVVDGDLGILDISAMLEFDPMDPELTRFYTTAGMDFLGIGLEFGVFRGPHIPGWWMPHYNADWIVAPALDSIQEAVYSVGVSMDPFYGRVRFVERHYDDQTPSNAIGWYDLLVQYSDIELCSCGITFDAELSLTKADGFNYFEVEFSDLLVFEWWTLGVEITYGIDYKSVELRWGFDAPVDAHIEFFVDSDEPFHISFDGFRITCELDTCDKFTYTLITGDLRPTYPYFGEEHVWHYQALGLEFCGPACCGDEYKVGFDLIWTPEGQGQLFGLSEFAGEFSVPLFDGFSLNVDFEHDLISGDTEMGLGWTFAF